MTTRKTIAIIGATGKVGSAIVKLLSMNHNYRLLLMSNDQGKLVELKLAMERSGAEVYPVRCAKQASWEADIIIMATPYDAEKGVAEKIREVAIGKIVISVSSPLNKTNNDLVTSPDTIAAQQLQNLLPASKVVKTFNKKFAGNFSTLLIHGERHDAFIAGSNADAVNAVSALVKSVGFNPVVVEGLTVSQNSSVSDRNYSSLMQIEMKDQIKSYFALAAFISISCWLLCHYAVTA